MKKNGMEARSDSELSELEAEKENQRHVGAAVLAAANFHTRYEKNVKPVFEKARKRAKREGKTIPGEKDERKTYAYLSRLEELIEKHGNAMEKRLWRMSIKDDLLIRLDNIPESYWEAKRQELRDSGGGDWFSKYDLVEKERKLQKESLEKWVNYLGDEHSPYPLWFKLYAWDGMTKMGVYDKRKGEYARRNKTTVAPYPEPNAEVLGGVFEVVNRFYGNKKKEFYTEEGERNIALEDIVRSGNFVSIYSAIERDIAPIVEPPENSEDVRGDWVIYGIGREDDIAIAARGTGWCIASSSVAKHYLEYGSSELGDGDGLSSLKSKFYLFHLKDPSTEGRLFKNAVASIRLGLDGQVAEISGLERGQALSDSLVDIVSEKVKTLPGGEKYLDAFADKRELTRLDHKMQKGEDLTREELEFIYEVNREIHTLDTYDSYDPRIDDLRGRYNLDYAKSLGVNIDIEQFLPRAGSRYILKNLKYLTEHCGAKIDKIVSVLSSDDIDGNYNTLLRHGANADKVVSMLDSDIVGENVLYLLGRGASADAIVSKINDDYISAGDNLYYLVYHHADIGAIISKLVFPEEYIDSLLDCGVKEDRIISSFVAADIISDGLFERISDPEFEFNGRILWDGICQKDKKLYAEHEKDNDVDFARNYIEETPLRFLTFEDNVETLLRNGVDPEDIASVLYASRRHNFDKDRSKMDVLMEYGLDEDAAVFAEEEHGADT